MFEVFVFICISCIIEIFCSVVRFGNDEFILVCSWGNGIVKIFNFILIVDRILWSFIVVWVVWYFLRFGFFVRLK